MNDAPTVSAILIFLNAEVFLREAIESVLSQTRSDWELLLIDDGSTDQSAAIARYYSEAQPQRIQYLTHAERANLGKSRSRNLGIERARGEYIAFLDADDVWLPSKLAEQVEKLSQHSEAVMLYGPTRYWYSWAPGHQHRDYLGVLGVRAGMLHFPPYLIIRFLERSGIVPGICSILARRNAILQTAGFEESIQHLFEDQTLIAKLCLYGPVYVDSACHDLYRQHSASSSAQAANAGLYHPWKPNVAHLAYLEWLDDYVARHGPEYTELRSALKHELWLQRHRFVGSTVSLGRVAVEIVRRAFEHRADTDSAAVL